VKPEELRLEEAVCRVSLKAAASSPPEVTTAEVRCLLEATATTLTDEDTATDYTTWDEEKAAHEVLKLHLNRSAALISESSAGQSSHMNQVHEHWRVLATAYEPWSAA
jgi:hypothetical protein